MATSKIKAVMECRCPKCRRGLIFPYPMYSFKSYRMDETCSNCGMKFEVEPGYFYAAMYVSYMLNVAEIISTAVATFYLSNGSDDPWRYIAVILAVIFLLAPFNYRYSRVILLHWLSPKVKYNPDLDK